ncbi:hypothetical protein [Deinococcus sp. QL22]|uniref:hypothetical protein n=1 Tax=Deinococcus sp. QL22 TaxID=2939437 RepID=UPI0020179C7B|nr:hypothetical protein [Deinococcus sp. QL22]UQN05653.1 hypothetical protein M1R55_12345 [Deinococcus sp. QL22]
MQAPDGLDIYDFEANFTEEHDLIIQLNDNARKHLIEMLESLASNPEVIGKHFHIDEVSGLCGNIKSIIFMRP